ncbi:unnamed protein product [Blepharisma stoltei]|uniref:Uncharacterized protein n=1 Tax=Blepharisma stoltei TaxID=1481888 RepID=A0AAU9J1M9_9CILI|nr:unnamed protein product [Blepharisma stoltei]
MIQCKSNTSFQLPHRRNRSKHRVADRLLKIIGDEKKSLNKQEKSIFLNPQQVKPISHNLPIPHAPDTPPESFASFRSELTSYRLLRLPSHDLNKESGIIKLSSTPTITHRKLSQLKLSPKRSDLQGYKVSRSVFESKFLHRLRKSENSVLQPRKQYFKISRSFRLQSASSYSPKPSVSPCSWRFTPI